VHRITVDTTSAPAVVTAEGELDAYVAPDLTQAFEEIADAPAAVADLAAVSFLDSTALGVVVRAVREIGDRQGRILVVLPTSAARRIFEITSLDRGLPVAETLADALEELRRGP
jgi:anti-sigma B factor antagonist